MRFLALTLVAGLALTACQPSEPAEAPEAPTAEAPAEVEMETAAPSAPLNLNTATSDEFKTIPDVGDKMAHEFEEYRPWTSVAQFRREIGKYIDDDAEILDGYLSYVYVPVSFDESDAETMMQLPGVGEAEAATLLEGRPYSTQEAFMARYAEVVPSGDAVAAAAYLAQ